MCSLTFNCSNYSALMIRHDHSCDSVEGPVREIPLRVSVDGGTGTVLHASGVGRHAAVTANKILTTTVVKEKCSEPLLFSVIFEVDFITAVQGLA